MTIDELKSNLKKINSALKLDVDLDDQPMGVWYESDDSSEDDLELFRIDENDFYFEPIINEIYEANSLIGSDTVKEVGDLLFKYFEPELSKESQKISNDSPKKTKEHLIHDFIKDAALMGFQCSLNPFDDAQTADIDVFDGESKYIMDINFISGARTFMVDDMEIDDLKRYSWLFTRVSTLISEWRKDEEQKDNQHDNDNH